MLNEYLGGEGQAPYDCLASIYNRHFGSYAERLVPILWRLILRELSPGACIVDLCCGTGQLAAILSRRGFQVVGIDESREMLRFAKENAPDTQFIRADAAKFDLPDPARGVVSTFDSVNHFLDPDILGAVFRNVFRNLTDGGIFVFDMNMEEGFRSRWRGEWEGIEDGRRYRIKAVYDEESRLGHNVVTMHHSGGRNRWSIRERCYSREQILAQLSDAGFSEVKTYDAESELGLIGAVGRTFFVCRQSSVSLSHESDETTTGRLRGIGHCSEDGVYPALVLERELSADSVRLEAIQEVLCTLPEDVYRRLISLSSGFSWFVPDEAVLGQVRAFPACRDRIEDNASRVIYLSPLLERHGLPVVVIGVAHEIAHVVLGHQLRDLDAATYERQEQEVHRALNEWGYGEIMRRAESMFLM